jgi:hypothetical protein
MAEIVAILSVVGELLEALTANLISATADEIPSLHKEVERLAQRDGRIDAPSDVPVAVRSRGLSRD